MNLRKIFKKKVNTVSDLFYTDLIKVEFPRGFEQLNEFVYEVRKPSYGEGKWDFIEIRFQEDYDRQIVTKNLFSLTNRNKDVDFVLNLIEKDDFGKEVLKWEIVTSSNTMFVDFENLMIQFQVKACELKTLK